jgi:ABC-2 type transport system ATP-binding protein
VTFFDGSILKSGKYIRDLSKGNQFKVGIAACLLQDPEIMILDEPFANLDPSSQIRLIHMMKELNERKQITILVSSHDLNNITDVCTRILLMEKGVIIKDLQTSSGTLNELEDYFRA